MCKFERLITVQLDLIVICETFCRTKMDKYGLKLTVTELNFHPVSVEIYQIIQISLSTYPFHFLLIPTPHDSTSDSTSEARG